MSFGTDTKVEPDADAPGRYRGEIRENWDVVGNTNGGYLMALAARAGSQSVDGRRPVSVTGHFLSPGRPGPIVVDTEVFKIGKRIATVGATVSILEDHGTERPLLRTIGAYNSGVVDDGAIERIDASPPELPDPADCVRFEPGDPFPPNIMGKVDLRLHPDDATFSVGRPVMRGWLRLLDDEPFDPYSLLLATDVFPPTVFNAKLPVAWAPTIELTAHLRSEAADGWLRCQYSSRFISGGMLEEDGEVWDSTGRLVAQSRQLALLPRA